MSNTCCVRNSSSRRLRTKMVTSSRVSATTLANPSVSRLWSVFGPAFRIIRGIRRGRLRRRRGPRSRSRPDPAAGASRRPAAPDSGPGAIGSGSPLVAGSGAVFGLPLGEGVADAADRHDERGHGRVVLDLVAQVADVDVD